MRSRGWACASFKESLDASMRLPAMSAITDVLSLSQRFVSGATLNGW